MILLQKTTWLIKEMRALSAFQIAQTPGCCAQCCQYLCASSASCDHQAAIMKLRTRGRARRDVADCYARDGLCEGWLVRGLARERVGSCEGWLVRGLAHTWQDHPTDKHNTSQSSNTRRLALSVVCRLRTVQCGVTSDQTTGHCRDCELVSS